MAAAQVSSASGGPSRPSSARDPDRVLITVPLTSGLEAAAQARRVVRGLLRQSHRPDLADTACLLTSELVANAMIHGGAPAELSVDLDGDRLEIEVIDWASGEPQLQNPAPDDLSGRGLHLVARLADAWGVHGRRGGGKGVWFVLTTDRAVRARGNEPGPARPATPQQPRPPRP